MKNYQKDFEFIRQFLDVDGISGQEFAVAEVYKKFAKEQGATITRDNFGSVIAKVGNAGPKILIAAHMDEVGFVVEQINKDGMLRISQVGGQWIHTFVSNQVKVITTEKKEFIGTIGTASVHVLPREQFTKVLTMRELFLDLGFNSEKEVRDAGIDVGDPVVKIAQSHIVGNGDKFMGKALDNRYGLAVIAKVLERIKAEKIDHPNQVYAVGTTQEEVGCRGARTAVQMLNPDLAISLDTMVSHDTPFVIPGESKLGKGVVVTIKDMYHISNPMFLEAVFKLAKENDIPIYKFVAQGGGNDASTLQFGGRGVPTLQLGVPTRYMHTVSEMGSFIDFNAVVDFLVAVIKVADEEFYQKTLFK